MYCKVYTFEKDEEASNEFDENKEEIHPRWTHNHFTFLFKNHKPLSSK